MRIVAYQKLSENMFKKASLIFANRCIVLLLFCALVVYTMWNSFTIVIRRQETNIWQLGGDHLHAGKVRNVRKQDHINVNVRTQLDAVLPNDLHTILSTFPFWKVSLLPLNRSIIDALLDGAEFQHTTSHFSFGVLPEHWLILQKAINSFGINYTQSQCEILTSNKACYTFRCMPGIWITLQALEKKSDYWTVSKCDGNGTSSAFKVSGFSSYLMSSYVSILLPNDLHAFRRHIAHGRFLECDYGAAKAFLLKQGPEYGRNATITEKNIVELVQLRDILHSLRMTPWLCGGTLLGWRRDCGIIPYTSDFDLCVPIAQFNEGLETIINGSRRFYLKYSFGKPSDSFEYAIYSNTGIRIDIFYMYQESNQTWLGGMGPGLIKLKYTYPLLNNLCAVDLLGYLFHVPCNVDEFVRADYGPNWTNPIRQENYVYFQSPHSVSYIGQWPAEEVKDVMKTFN